MIFKLTYLNIVSDVNKRRPLCWIVENLNLIVFGLIVFVQQWQVKCECVRNSIRWVLA